jgi:hypothetical protein
MCLLAAASNPPAPAAGPATLQPSAPASHLLAGVLLLVAQMALDFVVQINFHFLTFI